jgi:hypothetical protein
MVTGPVKRNEMINFDRKLELLSGQWSPRVVAELNDHQFKVVKEVRMLLIEPRGTLNTGRTGGERTAENDVWI